MISNANLKPETYVPGIATIGCVFTFCFNPQDVHPGMPLSYLRLLPIFLLSFGDCVFRRAVMVFALFSVPSLPGSTFTLRLLGFASGSSQPTVFAERRYNDLQCGSGFSGSQTTIAVSAFWKSGVMPYFCWISVVGDLRLRAPVFFIYSYCPNNF